MTEGALRRNLYSYSPRQLSHSRYLSFHHTLTYSIETTQNVILQNSTRHVRRPGPRVKYRVLVALMNCIFIYFCFEFITGTFHYSFHDSFNFVTFQSLSRNAEIKSPDPRKIFLTENLGHTSFSYLPLLWKQF